MSRPDESVVLKYCELLDEFIRIRTTPEEDATLLVGQGQVGNRASYHDLVVRHCVVDFENTVLPLFERHSKVYQTEALIELLYQICIEVNPHLEIHSVTLPAEADGSQPDAEGGKASESGFLEGEELAGFQAKVREIDEHLSSRVVGQDHAVAAISRSVKKASVGLKDPRKPIGTFMLVGPTGTGKTEMAKALTRQIHGNLSALVRIDCSEYALPHEYAKLIGAPPGYIGHNDGGQLTEAVKKQRFCVVLFDEIEKAHEKVHNLLLQIMDEGHLTDSKGESVSFQRCIVLLTSNIGVQDVHALADRVGFGAKGLENMDDDSMAFTVGEAVKKAFKPEFINRLDDVIQFRPLTMDDCRAIAGLQLREMAGYLERTGVRLRFTPSLEAHLAELGWSAEYGARELRRHIRDQVEDQLTERLMSGEFGSGDTITVSMRGREKVSMTCRRAKVGAQRQRVG